MNSYNRGKTFENTVFDFFQDELKSERFLVSGKTSKLFKGKKYYSPYRKSNIVIDISIETYLPNQENYSLLILIECKDYNKTVPIDDIEEFYSKCQQISGLNVKAIFVTTSALQKSSLEFAKNKGIAVIRYFPDRKFFGSIIGCFPTHNLSAIMIRDNYINENLFYDALTNIEHENNSKYFYGFDNDTYYANLNSLLDAYIKSE